MKDGDIRRLIFKMEKIKVSIAMDRDKLRDIMDECESVLEAGDAAIADLDSAIESLSQYV